jgi:hypothetical protein
MTLGGADRADEVARGIVQSLHRSGTIVPVGKLLTFALSWLPRLVRVRIMGRIISGMSGRVERKAGALGMARWRSPRQSSKRWDWMV